MYKWRVLGIHTQQHVHVDKHKSLFTYNSFNFPSCRLNNDACMQNGKETCLDGEKYRHLKTKMNQR